MGKRKNCPVKWERLNELRQLGSRVNGKSEIIRGIRIYYSRFRIQFG